MKPAALATEIGDLLSRPNAGQVQPGARVRELLAELEAATPGGAPLHRQIDTVRRWVGVLENDAEHARFGGLAHLRDYLDVQLRLLRAAVDDYEEESP